VPTARRLSQTLGVETDIISFMVNRTLILILATTSLASFAQSQAYVDATSQLNAAGLLKIRLRNVEYLRSECSTLFPDKAKEFQTQVTAWHTIDAVPIAKTEEIWPELLERQPKVEEAVIRVTGATAFSIAMLKGIEPTGEKTLLLGFCQRQIADGTSAVWRTRTPEIYRFLEEER
jgi:hypothetical protein